MQKTYRFSIDIPAHLVARLSYLSSRYGCTPKTIMLAGIIDIVETGNRSFKNYVAQDEFKFKMALVEGAFSPKKQHNGGK